MKDRRVDMFVQVCLSTDVELGPCLLDLLSSNKIIQRWNGQHDSRRVDDVIKGSIFFKKAVHLNHDLQQCQGECTLGYHVIICNVLDVSTHQLSPREKVQ